MSTEKSTPVDIEPASTDGQVSGDIDPAVERSYGRIRYSFLYGIRWLMLLIVQSARWTSSCFLFSAS